MSDAQGNITDFETAAKMGALISRDYAPGLLRLLATYRDISASEAAARLDLHIKTAQDFLEGLAAAGIARKKEAEEKTRPYYRYSLRERVIRIEVDLSSFSDPEGVSARGSWRIRERQGSGTLFKEGRDDRITSVHVYSGEGRSRKERRLSLTEPQGRFLFHLPFPSQKHKSVEQIRAEAGIDEECLPEVVDLVETLLADGAIEREDR